jgi:hypothetical protein
MALYEQRPPRVEAIQWTGRNIRQIREALPAMTELRTGDDDPGLYLHRPTGPILVPVDWWIVHLPDVFTSIGIMDDDEFEATYVRVHGGGRDHDDDDHDDDHDDD